MKLLKTYILANLKNWLFGNTAPVNEPTPTEALPPFRVNGGYLYLQDENNTWRKTIIFDIGDDISVTHQHSWGSINDKPSAFTPDAHAHSGADAAQWVEGSMHNALTASLSNTDWLWVPENDPYRVVYAIDSVLGSGWQGGGGGGDPLATVQYWYRPYWLNKMVMDNSPSITLGFMSSAEAYITASAVSSECVVDGIDYVNFTDAATNFSGAYGTFPLPSTIETIYWNGGGSSFSYIFDTLYNCPWHPYLGGKLIDCGAGTYSTSDTFLLSDSQQAVLEALAVAGNTVVLPDNNLLNNAWHLVPVFPGYLLVENSVTYETILATRGDGISDGLLDEEMLYTLPPAWESTNEASPVDTTAVFPRRDSDHGWFYRVIVEGDFPRPIYIAAKPDFNITGPY